MGYVLNMDALTRAIARTATGIVAASSARTRMTSAATVAVAARPNRPATGAPTISGTAQVGETLTADVSAITDADGLSNAVYEY